MNKNIKLSVLTAALEGFMFYMLWLALHDNAMATNFVLFMAWTFKVVCSVLILIAASTPKVAEALLPVFLKHNGKHWNIYDAATDIAFCAGLAAGGWFWTAGFGLLGCFMAKGVKQNVIDKYGKTQLEAIS